MNWNEVPFRDKGYLKITTLPFQDEDYVAQGAIILIEDISQEHFMKNYLMQTERVASIAELVAGTAHEVNNPLNIILNYVELLKIKNSEPYAGEKLGKIESELNRIKAIIASLLSFSHPNEQPLARLDLIPVLQDTILLLNHKFRDKDLQIRLELGGEAIPVAANENRIKQLFINLLINAAEAAPAGGWIAVTARTEDSYTVIRIRDNGPGIPEDVREKIFTPFFTTKPAKQNTGLGLSICQHIIEGHRGILSYEPEPETTFVIRLPLSGDDLLP